MSKLNSKSYRHEYVNGFQDGRLAAQILSLRERAGMSQTELAAALGTKQSRISQLENGNYDAWSVRMLRNVAVHFDVALSVKFDSFKTVLADLKKVDAATLLPESYVPAEASRAIAIELVPVQQTDLAVTIPAGYPSSAAYFFSAPFPQSEQEVLAEAANENLALAA